MASPEQLTQDVCDALAAAAPRGWRRVRLRVWGSVVTYQLEATVAMADGSSPVLELPPLTGTLAELRARMYRPGRGTWFSARFELRSGEPPEADFDYDGDPQWWPEVPPSLFARDLEIFPRADEHVPAWLRARLDEAARGERPVPGAPG
ncbi:hypothetical protein [Qaidamihabitans albus]|uniref:hypothetical protein n=1 Tax=Qaidamihabitans albus TaxID=2795733 RepID=UPI0018F198FA|nr:hypothetical protein [Qaidamihabitans albus]